jgi:hypothetical protein
LSPSASAIVIRGAWSSSGGRERDALGRGGARRGLRALDDERLALDPEDLRGAVAVEIGEGEPRRARGAHDHLVVAARRRLRRGDREAVHVDRAVGAGREALVATVAVHVRDAVPEGQRLARAALEERRRAGRIGDGTAVRREIRRRGRPEEAQAHLAFRSEAPDRDRARDRARTRGVAGAGDAHGVGGAEERARGRRCGRVEDHEVGLGQAIRFAALDQRDQIGAAVAVEVAGAHGLDPPAEVEARGREVGRMRGDAGHAGQREGREAEADPTRAASRGVHAAGW